jgi:ABC-2 type transport system ATP-binding protein
MDPLVKVTGLRKRYGDRDVVAGVDLEIGAGEVFALLGPNGAGKTTTVEILEGQRKRTAGQVQVLGVDPWSGGRAFHERIGVVLQSAGLTLELTLRETVELYRGYYPRPLPVDEAISLVGLTAERHRRVSRLSGGQLRRLDLAIALVGNPELIFLDEPTTGFDPRIRAQAWQTIQALRDSGRAILLTTHYMEEAYRLADRIAIMAGGRIVAEGSPAALTDLSERSSVIRFRLPDGAGTADLPGGLREATVVDGFVRATIREPERSLHELTAWALERGFELRGLSVERPTLEDVYLTLTDEPARSMAGHEFADN